MTQMLRALVLSRLLHRRRCPCPVGLPGIHTGELLGDPLVPGDPRADGCYPGPVRAEVGGPDCGHAAQDLLPGDGGGGVEDCDRM